MTWYLSPFQMFETVSHPLKGLGKTIQALCLLVLRPPRKSYAKSRLVRQSSASESKPASAPLIVSLSSSVSSPSSPVSSTQLAYEQLIAKGESSKRQPLQPRKKKSLTSVSNQKAGNEVDRIRGGDLDDTASSSCSEPDVDSVPSGKLRGGSLLVCPVSVLSNWEHQIQFHLL